MSDYVEIADAKIQLTAGMTAVLLASDSEEFLRQTFDECLPRARDGYAAELNRILKNTRAGIKNVDTKGPAGTRELWIGMITKFLASGVFRESDVRDFFEDMMARAKTRLAKS